MVSMTKKIRYSRRVVKALMENYHELETTLVDANPYHMNPMYDYTMAVERVDLSPLERKVFEVRYPMNDVCPNGLETSHIVGVDPAYISRISDSIFDKIFAEMNRGLTDV